MLFEFFKIKVTINSLLIGIKCFNILIFSTMKLLNKENLEIESNVILDAKSHGLSNLDEANDFLEQNNSSDFFSLKNCNKKII